MLKYLFAALLCCAASAQAQTLEQTQNWIKNNLVARNIRLSWSPDGSSQQSDVILVSHTGCQIAVVEAFEPSGLMQYYIVVQGFKVDLKDFDPRPLPSHSRFTSILFQTVDSAAAVRTLKRWKNIDTHPGDYVPGRSNTAVLMNESTSLLDRIKSGNIGFTPKDWHDVYEQATDTDKLYVYSNYGGVDSNPAFRALQHAITLCGGQKSFFFSEEEKDATRGVLSSPSRPSQASRRSQPKTDKRTVAEIYSAAEAWRKMHPEYVSTSANAKLMLGYMVEHGLDPRQVESYEQAFTALSDVLKLRDMAQ